MKILLLFTASHR